MKKLFWIFAGLLLVSQSFAQTDPPYSEWFIHKYGTQIVTSFFRNLNVDTVNAQLIGNVTGNLTGTVTGSVAGPVTTNVLWGASGTAYHKISIQDMVATNLNALVAYQGNVNTTHANAAGERDTSAFSVWFTGTGKPLMSLKGATGANILSVDSGGNTTLTGNMIYAASGTPYSLATIIPTVATNLNALTIYDTDVNTTHANAAGERDTSAVSIWYTGTGKPMIQVTSATGTTLLSLDSAGTITLPTLAAKLTLSAAGTNWSLKAIAAGDSVVGHQIWDAADTTLKVWNGTAWKTVADLGN